MTREDMIRRLSAKLRKNMQWLSPIHEPKMVCDNLAILLLNEVERNGMLPPLKSLELMGANTDTMVGIAYVYEQHEWELENE